MTESQHPIQLIVQYYRCTDIARQEEIDTCLRENLQNPLIEATHLLTEERFDFVRFPNHEKIIQTVIGERLTFERAFRYVNEADPSGERIWVLTNADIYFDDTLRLVEWKNLDGVVYALTRHDLQADGSIKLVPPEFAHGCQDVWMFRTLVPLNEMVTDFPLGIAGCDHRIAYEFSVAGRAVANPSLSVVVRHLDLTRQVDIHTKTEEYTANMNDEGYRLGKVVSPPYLYCLHPTAKLVYPDLSLMRQHIAAASCAFQRENELVGQLNGERSLVNALQQTISGLEDEIIRKNQALYEMEVKVTSQADRIAGLEGSLSWRVTKPLRTMGDIIARPSRGLSSGGCLSEKSTGIDSIREALEKHKTDLSTVLVLDFSLGGGSNLYSHNLIDHLETSGRRVVVLAYRYGSSIYHLSTRTGDGIAETRIAGNFAGFFHEVVNKLSVFSIIINQLVSWPKTSSVLGTVEKSDIPYIVLLHDHFLICPNWTLFDYQEKFCGIPSDFNVCTKCLKNLYSLDVPLAQHTAKLRIKPWRISSNTFLIKAEKVVCFSGATLLLAKKAFPQLNNLEINEHFVPDPQMFEWKERSCNGGPLIVAVIGGINLAKGSKLLEGLLRALEQKDMPVKLVLFGTINPPVQQTIGLDKYFVHHGPYDRAELGSLLVNYGVSLVFTPSLCPETFCYTASEALLLGFPVVCFDLGAQAERVRRFGCGWVLTEPNVDWVLIFFQEILDNPHLVREKSLQTQNYLPPSALEHFSCISGVLETSKIS